MQVARQIAAYRLLQQQAMLACSDKENKKWLQSGAEPRAFSVKQIRNMVIGNQVAGRAEFRALTNGQTGQAADVIVMEYETLAAATSLCSSVAGEQMHDP